MSCIACRSHKVYPVEKIIVDDFFTKLSIERNFDVNDVQSLKRDLEKYYEIYHCDSCGLEFANPMRGGNSDFYELIYRYMPRTGIRWEFTELQNDFKRRGSLLDIGCGDGSFVKYAQERGFIARGIDFNTTRVDIGKASNINLDIINVNELNHYLSSKEKFSIFTLWHVLEHLENPDKTLMAIRENSKQGAVLALSVPSDRFYLTHRSGNAILNYPPHHLTRWTELSLKKIGEQCGWIMAGVKYEPLDGALRIYGQRIVKSLLINHNFLEELKILMAKRKFSEKLLSPRNDAYLNNVTVKVLGRILYYILLLDKKNFSGMSMYVKFKRS